MASSCGDGDDYKHDENEDEDDEDEDEIEMAKVTLTLLLISALLSAATCQTFQYSRGWTNGKRSDSSFLPLPELKIMEIPMASYDLHTTQTLSALCCEGSCSSKKIVKLLRANGKSQLYLVPCDLLQAHRHGASQEKQLDILPADGHFRRSLSTEYDNNNDNY